MALNPRYVFSIGISGGSFIESCSEEGFYTFKMSEPSCDYFFSTFLIEAIELLLIVLFDGCCITASF